MAGMSIPDEWLPRRREIERSLKTPLRPPAEEDFVRDEIRYGTMYGMMMMPEPRTWMGIAEVPDDTVEADRIRAHGLGVRW
jgi:hypothetical protein